MIIIVAGAGETGKPVIRLEHEVGNRVLIEEIDGGLDTKGCDVLHICFTYSDSFIDSVISYINKHKPHITIIHSTVKPGTTDKINDAVNPMIVHSPIIGVHPNLYDGIKTFKKAVGGDKDSCVFAIKHLNSIGLDCYRIGTAIESEFAKILSTTYYGWNILFSKFVNKICIDYDLSYDMIYSEWNKQYNDGYYELGMFNVIRPVLKPPTGKIGGHCVSQNFELLPDGLLKETVLNHNKEVM